MEGFGGEIAALYRRYRHGYSEAVLRSIGDAFGLSPDDLAIDLGCGTGQLSIPLARRVRAVVGMDPEPAMLEQARLAAAESGTANVFWVLGSDADLSGLGEVVDAASVGVVTVGQALHWMDRRRLFGLLADLLRPRAGLAIVSNGIPLWQQDAPWSRRLRAFLEEWLQAELSPTCGTDAATQAQYRSELGALGFEVSTSVVDSTVTLGFDALLGGLLSAMGTGLPGAADRPRFDTGVRDALGPGDEFLEALPVTTICARLPVR